MTADNEAVVPSGRSVKIKLAVAFVLLFALCGGGMYVLQPTPCGRLANVVCPGESAECTALKTALEEWGDPETCERWADEIPAAGQVLGPLGRGAATLAAMEEVLGAERYGEIMDGGIPDAGPAN